MSWFTTLRLYPNIFLLKCSPVYLFTYKKSRISRVFYPDLFHHLSNNYFYVFIVNRAPLQSVDFLDFINKIALKFLWPKYIKYIMGVYSTIHKRFSSHYPVTFMHTHMFAFWNKIFPCIISSLNNNNT